MSRVMVDGRGLKCAWSEVVVRHEGDVVTGVANVSWELREDEGLIVYARMRALLIYLRNHAHLLP